MMSMIYVKESFNEFLKWREAGYSMNASVPSVIALVDAEEELAKQMPRKPIRHTEFVISARGTEKEETVSVKCPRCEKVIREKHKWNKTMSSYCDKCGQALDWSN